MASTLLACLLVLAQWTGFSLVLCISGPDHVQVESADAVCCRHVRPARTGAFEGGGGCMGCTDLSLERPSDWDPSSRRNIGGEHAVIGAAPACGVVRSAARGATFEFAPSALLRSTATSPLRC